MLHAISNRFYSWAKGWLALTLAALDLAFMGFVMPLAGKLAGGAASPEPPLDLLFFSAPSETFARLERYDERARLFYLGSELTLDILHPILYTLALGLLISWLFQRGFARGDKMRILNVTPLGAWSLDLLENLCIVAMLALWPERSVPLAWMLTVFRMGKWIFVGASAALAAAGFALAARNGFKPR